MALKVEGTQPKLVVLLTVKKYYALAATFRTCWYANVCLENNDKVSSYIAEIGKKVMLYWNCSCLISKLHFFNRQICFSSIRACL